MKKGHSGIFNDNDGEAVLLSAFRKRLEHVRKEMNNYEEEILKKLIRMCRMTFNDNIFNLFQKHS